MGSARSGGRLARPTASKTLKAAAAPRLAVNVDVAACLLDDAVYRGQAQARALAPAPWS